MFADQLATVAQLRRDIADLPNIIGPAGGGP